MGDAQRTIFVPLEVMAVPSDLLLYLLSHRSLIVFWIHVLPVGINEACPGGRGDRSNSVPIDVFDASRSELFDELGSL